MTDEDEKEWIPRSLQKGGGHASPGITIFSDLF
jgi:hypothetical protein